MVSMRNKGDQFASRPTGRAIDPNSGKEANFKGHTENGDPIYRVPGTSREQIWVQSHPLGRDGVRGDNVPFAGAKFKK